MSLLNCLRFLIIKTEYWTDSNNVVKIEHYLNVFLFSAKWYTRSFINQSVIFFYNIVTQKYGLSIFVYNALKSGSTFLSAFYTSNVQSDANDCTTNYFWRIK